MTLTQWAVRLMVLVGAVVAGGTALRSFRRETRPPPVPAHRPAPMKIAAPSPAREPAASPAPAPADSRAPDPLEAPLVEGPAESAPDCLHRAYQLAEPLRSCVPDPANRDCGVRYAFDGRCQARKVFAWGKLERESRACLSATAVTAPPPTTVTTVWLVDYPLGAPAYMAAPEGIADDHWLRRGTPLAPEAMKAIPTIRLGPRAAVAAVNVTATFGTRRYRLRSAGGSRTDVDAPTVVALESEGRTQVLVEDASAFRVRWAGDVDGDGRLDLLLESTLSSMVRRLDLFLSSGAEGRLVHLAATDQQGAED